MDSHSTTSNCKALVYSDTSLLTTFADSLTLNLEESRGLGEIRESKYYDAYALLYWETT